MKRPLGLIGFFYFAGLMFATGLGVNFAVAMGVFLLLAGGGVLFVSKLRATGVIPAALLSCSSGLPDGGVGVPPVGRPRAGPLSDTASSARHDHLRRGGW